MRRYPAIEPPNGEASDGSMAGAGNGGASGESDEPFDGAHLDDLFDQVEPEERFDPANLDALRTALEAETDHALIAQIEAEELAWLNGDP
jgi:hypothetical protein